MSANGRTLQLVTLSSGLSGLGTLFVAPLVGINPTGDVFQGGRAGTGFNGRYLRSVTNAPGQVWGAVGFGGVEPPDRQCWMMTAIPSPSTFSKQMPETALYRLDYHTDRTALVGNDASIQNLNPYQGPDSNGLPIGNPSPIVQNFVVDRSTGEGWLLVNQASVAATWQNPAFNQQQGQYVEATYHLYAYNVAQIYSVNMLTGELALGQTIETPTYPIKPITVVSSSLNGNQQNVTLAADWWYYPLSLSYQSDSTGFLLMGGWSSALNDGDVATPVGLLNALDSSESFPILQGSNLFQVPYAQIPGGGAPAPSCFDERDEWFYFLGVTIPAITNTAPGFGQTLCRLDTTIVPTVPPLQCQLLDTNNVGTGYGSVGLLLA